MKPTKILAAVTLIVATLIPFSVARSADVKAGQGPLGDFINDAPGVQHHVTVNDLPEPYATKSVDSGQKLIKRPAGAMPKVPDGFKVSEFLTGLKNPRLIRTAPNGDVFLSESEAGRVRVLRFPDGADKPAVNEVFASGLHQPFGIAFYPPGPDPKYVYIGNTDAVVRFPYKNGDTKATGPMQKITDLAGGGRLRGGGHWTRDVTFSADGKTLFASVGSHSNVAEDPNEDETDRANVLSFTPEGQDKQIYASGVRNAVGIAIHPTTGELWVSVNERDGLGDDLVPDYITHITPGGFYGWPWWYIGGHQDPRHKGEHPELQSKLITPDVLLQSHSASLEMTFYTGAQFPEQYKGTIFAAEHGSWNRAHRTGYKVIAVPLKDGKALGTYEDFMTGFVTKDGEVWGRPVGVTVAHDGSLLVTDDAENMIWRVSYGK